MRYQQLKDILIHLDEMHVALARLYQRWLPAAEDEHPRLLLIFMHKQEKLASERLARCLQDTDPSLLHSWLDVQVDSGFADKLQGCRPPADMTVAQILERASLLDNAIIGELEAIRGHLPTSHLEKWLEGLLAAEHNHTHHLLHNAQCLEVI